MRFHVLQKRNQRQGIVWVMTQIDPGDVLRIDSVLKIIGRFQLPVPHGIFFQAHECRVRIGLGIAVSLPADMKMLCVFFQLADIAFQRFNRFLQPAFPAADSIDKGDLFFFLDLIEFFAQPLHGMKCRFTVIDHFDSV